MNGGFMGFCCSLTYESFASHQNQQENQKQTTLSLTLFPPKKTKPNNPETLSFQNMQTRRVCSLEICTFRLSPSGNHFCQMLKAEAKQILTTSCSLLVLKSMATWWSSLLESWKVSDSKTLPRIITDVSHLRISSAFTLN